MPKRSLRQHRLSLCASVVVALWTACSAAKSPSTSAGHAAAAGVGDAGRAATGDSHAGAAGSVDEAGSGARGAAGRDAGAAAGSGGAGKGIDAAGAGAGGGRSNGGAGSAGGKPAAPGSQWVMGYYPGYEMDKLAVADIDWTGISHIIFGSVQVNADYTLALDFYVGTEAQGRAAAMQVADAAAAHGVVPVLMLGGAGVSNISGAIAANVQKLADALIAATTALHYKGIDLDIEDGSSLASQAMLAKPLRASKSDIILTYPGPSMQFAEKTVKPELVEIAGYVDRFAMQSYYGGSSGLFTGSDDNGHLFQSWFSSALHGATALTPYAIDDAMSKFAAAGISKQKLAMGIAGYAACYKIPDTTPQGGTDISGPRMEANASQSWCWDCGTGGGDGKFSLADVFAGDGTYAKASAAERKRDDISKEPFLGLDQAHNDSHCGGSTRYIVFEDETSIRDKGAFSKANGYGGIIVWTIPQLWLPANAAEGRARNSLFQALKAGFLDP